MAVLRLLATMKSADAAVPELVFWITPCTYVLALTWEDITMLVSEKPSVPVMALIP